MIMIEIKNISKTYDDKRIIDNFSLSIKDGEWIVLSMPSGAGKSTFFRLLAGIEKADEGSIEGVKSVAMVFQEDRLCENFSALENVALVLPGKTDKNSIIKSLKTVGIDDYKKPVKELSGGQRRRVALVRALMCPAELVILDEPLVGLDDATIKVVTEYIFTECEGKSVVIATHNQEFIKVLVEMKGAKEINGINL